MGQDYHTFSAIRDVLQGDGTVILEESSGILCWVFLKRYFLNYKKSFLNTTFYLFQGLFYIVALMIQI